MSEYTWHIGTYSNVFRNRNKNIWNLPTLGLLSINYISITSCPLTSSGVEDSRGNIAGVSLLKFKSLSQRTFSVMCTEPATPSLESKSFLSPSLLIAVVGGDGLELLWIGMMIKGPLKRGEGLVNWRETSAHASRKNHRSTAAKKTRLRKKKASGT